MGRNVDHLHGVALGLHFFVRSTGGASWGCRTRNAGAAPDGGCSRPAAPQRAGPSAAGRTGRTSGPCRRRPTGGPPCSDRTGCGRSRGPGPRDHLWDDARHGFRLTDETFSPPPVRISRRGRPSASPSRASCWPTTKRPRCTWTCARSWTRSPSRWKISIEPDWLSEHVGVLPEDRVRIDPEVWAQVAGHIERREAMRADYQSFAGTGFAVRPAPLAPVRL